MLQILDLLQTQDVAILITKCHQKRVILSGWISFSLPHADFDLLVGNCRWLSGDKQK